MTTRKQLEKIGVKVEDLISIVGSPEWDKEFYDGYGGVDGDSFVAWTEDHVIFCICYDGSEWLEKLPRHPGKFFLKPHHFGGG